MPSQFQFCYHHTELHHNVTKKYVSEAVQSVFLAKSRIISGFHRKFAFTVSYDLLAN